MSASILETDLFLLYQQKQQSIMMSLIEVKMSRICIWMRATGNSIVGGRCGNMWLAIKYNSLSPYEYVERESRTPKTHWINLPVIRFSCIKLVVIDHYICIPGTLVSFFYNNLPTFLGKWSKWGRLFQDIFHYPNELIPRWFCNIY